MKLKIILLRLPPLPSPLVCSKVLDPSIYIKRKKKKEKRSQGWLQPSEPVSWTSLGSRHAFENRVKIKSPGPKGLALWDSDPFLLISHMTWVDSHELRLAEVHVHIWPHDKAVGNCSLEQRPIFGSCWLRMLQTEGHRRASGGRHGLSRISIWKWRWM